MSEKPHKGKIYNWKKMFWTDEGLGYVIWGDFKPCYVIRTSYVVKHDEVTGEIETRNSRYTLVPHTS